MKAYTGKYGEAPSRYAEFGYTAANVVGAVSEALKGEVEDPPRVAKEIMRVWTRIETPAGPLAFALHQGQFLNTFFSGGHWPG